MVVGHPEPSTNGRLKVPQAVIYLLVTLLSVGASSLIAYYNRAESEQDKRSAISTQVAVLQSQVTNLEQQLKEMRADVKKLLERQP